MEATEKIKKRKHLLGPTGFLDGHSMCCSTDVFKVWWASERAVCCSWPRWPALGLELWPTPPLQSSEEPGIVQGGGICTKVTDTGYPPRLFSPLPRKPLHQNMPSTTEGCHEITAIFKIMLRHYSLPLSSCQHAGEFSTTWCFSED